MSTSRRLAALIALAFVTVACSSSTDASATIEGSYSLRQIDGANLPYSFPSCSGGSATIVLAAGALTLKSDKTYLTELTWAGSQSQVEDNGTYSVQGDQIVFTSSQSMDKSATGAISSGTILFNRKLAVCPGFSPPTSFRFQK